MNSGEDAEVDEIAQRIMFEIEKRNSKELMDSNEMIKLLHLTQVHHAMTILSHMDSVSTQDERNVGKKAVIRALLLSTWLQRLYFIIRTFIMGGIGSVITFSFILYFGSINVTLGVVLGVIGLISSLAITRLFDVQIVRLTKRIVAILGDHKTLRDFIINHF